nr:guanylate kinase [uncultured Desulfobulbus sp.]
MNKGLLFVLSAPSGCGKTTILKEVMRRIPALVFSVSHTTRSPRAGEIDGEHYHFVSAEDFLALRDQEPSGFLEWAEVHGNFYGTSVAEVDSRCQLGEDVVLDIDVQGAAQVREAASPVTIFIAPPSLEILEQRLRGRGTETEETVCKRLKNARAELAQVDAYEYVIVNDALEEAVEALCSIIIAERSRQRRDRRGLRLQWADA